MANKQAFEVGQKVTFTGYTQLGAGEPEILSVGTDYTIDQIKPDGGIVVVGSDGRGDTVFDDEIAPVSAKTTGRAKAKAPAKANAPKTAKAVKATKVTTPKTAKAKATKTAKGKKTTTAKKSTKVELVPGGKVTPIAPLAATAPITDSETVTKLLETNDMLTAAKQLAVAAEETFLSLGGVLHHIYNIGAHKQLGYDGKRGFADYMLKELNIQYRKGMYLIEIYETARKLNLDESLLAQIGWSKMKEITGKLDAANAEELLTFARDHTREELVQHVRTSYVKAGEATDDPGRVLKTRLTFNLFADQVDTVQRALSAASAQIDNPTPETALLLIAAEWSQFTEAVDLSSQQMIEAAVERFGVDAVRDAVNALAEKNATQSTGAELVSA